jgi:uncharacterized protein (TIGR02598 family)
MIASSGRGCSASRGFNRAKQPQAFSLVEVVLSLGIVSFAFLVMAALVPVGIQSTKDSLEETGAIDLLSNLIADRKASAFAASSNNYSLSPLTTAMSFTSNAFGVTATNTPTANFGQSVFRVTYEITPPQAGSLNPYQIYFKISWPAPAVAAPAGYVEQTVAMPQP